MTQNPNSASIGTVAGQLWREVLADMRRITPGELRCGDCGTIAPERAFARGKGREYGQHPEHRFCQRCGHDITWGRYTDYACAQALLRRTYKGATA